jgi:hypothetical protein
MPRELVDWELLIPIDDGSQRPIFSLTPHESRKVLGVEDCLAGGNVTQLESIKEKVKQWMNRMKMAIFQQNGPELRINTNTGQASDME